VYDPIPVPNRASLGPFVLNSTFEPKPIQSVPEPAEYSSSFFDDYEEDYEGGSEVNSDDDFDESTLWEIATLLDSEDVPSRNSLFPCPRIIEDYDDEDDSEPDVSESTSNPNPSTRASEWPAMVKFIPIQPLKPLPPLPTSQQSDDGEQPRAGTERNSQHAAAPVWQAYLPALDDAARGKPYEAVSQDSRPRPKADARTLWDKAIGAVSSLPVEKAITLWTQRSSGAIKKSSPISELETSKEGSRTKLWTARKAQIVPPVVGLFAVGAQREDYRTSDQVPAALTTIRKPRVDTTPLATLSSQQLWSPIEKPPYECHWISLSSIWALSPALLDASSSGRSSPSSDGESVASATTNASSIASSAELKKEPTCREANAFPTIGLPAADLGRPVAVDQPSKRPTSLKGSRILASRDLWEPSAPVTDSTLNQKIWRSSKIFVPEAFQENKRKVGTATPHAEQDVTLPEATKLAIEYDTAVRHPVFFTSRMVSSAAYVHPAATGHVTQLATSHGKARKITQLWTSSQSIAVQVPSSVSLWSKPSLVEKQNPSPWSPPVKETVVRKTTKDPPPLILPSLSSTSFWRPTVSINSSVQHWLHATALRPVPASLTTTEQSPLSMFLANTFLEESPAPPRLETVTEVSVIPARGRASTWTAPKRPNTTSGSQCNSLWVPAGDKEHDQLKSSPTYVVPSKRPSSYKPAQRQAGVDKVESTGLWRPKWGLPESPENWLTSRRATKVDFRY
jgi:hypothetical protein